MANLRAHLRIVSTFGVPAVVVINQFPTDSQKELELVRKLAIEAGAAQAVVGDYWSRGGEGARELAEAVVEACEQPSNFKFTYPLDMSIREKIKTIATQIYRAGKVIFEQKAEKQIAKYEKLGLGHLPICMAKSHLSISHDPRLKGDPQGYTLPVREVRVSAGAGFIYPLLGEMQTMPGLPSRPAFMNVDLDTATGQIKGLF